MAAEQFAAQRDVMERAAVLRQAAVAASRSRHDQSAPQQALRAGAVIGRARLRITARASSGDAVEFRGGERRLLL